MTYLVTGGKGLVGSRVVRDLVREGERVVVYDIDPTNLSLQQLLEREDFVENVKIVQGDVTDLSYLLRVLDDEGVDKVIHTVSLLTSESNRDPVKAIRVNCEGTVCVFEAAKTLGLSKVVWASSNAAFGPHNMYCQEYVPNDAPHYPQDIYGATKAFNEVAASYYHDRHKVDITGIRYMYVYGAGQGQGFFGPIIRELIVNPAIGKPGRVPYGDALIGWSYVDDSARATVMASKKMSMKTKTFSMMGDVRSVHDVADYVKQLLPDSEITVLPGTFRSSPVKFDTSAIENEIGYTPNWSMERGVKKTINTVRMEHGFDPV